MGNEIQLIQFHEDQIEAIRDGGGKAYVVIRRICENLGVDVAGQLRNLKVSHWACVDEMSIQIGDQLRQVAVLPLDQLPMWLVRINVRKVAVDIRPKLKLYQLEARDVLAAHFAPQETEQPTTSEKDPLRLLAQMATGWSQMATGLSQAFTEIADLKEVDQANSRSLMTMKVSFTQDLERVESKADLSIDLTRTHHDRLFAIPELKIRGYQFPREEWPQRGKELSEISRRVGFDDEPQDHTKIWNGFRAATYIPEVFDVWEREKGPKYKPSPNP
jgi:hypothetical protein